MLAQLTVEKKRGQFRADFDGKTLYVFDRDNQIVLSLDRDVTDGLEDMLILMTEVVEEHDSLKAYQERTAELDHLSEMGVEGV